VSVKVLDIDLAKRRISLSLKQAHENPWEVFGRKHKTGDIIEGEIKNIAEFGLFVGLEGNIDGMIHVSDLAWGSVGEQTIAEYQKGQMVKAKIIDIDLEKERISLGVKQLSDDPFETNAKALKNGEIVTCTVKTITSSGIEVSTDKGLSGFIRKADLSRDRSEQRTDRFAVGELVDAQVISIDPKTRKLGFSIKARELAEEKKVMEQYGSSDSGASLGEILGGALDSMKHASKKSAEKASAKTSTKKKEAGVATEAKAPAKKAKAKADTEDTVAPKAAKTTKKTKGTAA
jgi:small subunit ribosomal protein S1